MIDGEKIKGISRIDSGNTHGWYVRFYYGGKTTSKLFSDGKYGGREIALEAAVQYKAEYEQTHPRLRENHPAPYRRRPQRNNKTGINGISESKSRHRNGRVEHYYSVFWSPQPGVSRVKKFSIDRHGRDKAFLLAVEFRQEKEQEMTSKKYQIPHLDPFEMQ